MAIIDLSHPIEHGQPNFPSDPKTMVVEHGNLRSLGYNMTQIAMGTHNGGTHLDAMFHFYDDGRTIDKMPLDWFYGPARVLRIPKGKREEITVEDFKAHEPLLLPEAKIIYETGWSKQVGKPDYFSDFPSLTVEAAKYLVSRRIRMLGMDTPTPSREWKEVHNILLHKDAEIVLVEGLANLQYVPDRFTYAGFPLNIKGRDGSPVRAVAITNE